MFHKIVAIVGMPGSGKTEVSRFFELQGFLRIRFGEITEEHIKQNNLEINENNERRIREFLRKKYGNTAYAFLNFERIKTALETNNVVIDGMYSWEEFMFLKEKFNEKLVVLAVYAPPNVRHLRLNTRTIRPLNKDEAISRDITQIENLNQAGPIAMADHTIINIKTLIDLRNEVDRFLKVL